MEWSPSWSRDWRTITISDTNETFIVSIVNESNGNFLFNLSDFKVFWRERIDSQEILRRAKVSFIVFSISNIDLRLKNNRKNVGLLACFTISKEINLDEYICLRKYHLKWPKSFNKLHSANFRCHLLLFPTFLYSRKHFCSESQILH